MPVLPGAPLYAGDTSAPRFARLLAAIPVEFGALGVALFFIISGYVIAISLDRYSRRGFIVGRFMRVRGVPGPFAVIAAGAAAILAAWVLHRALEGPSHRLGRRWARQFPYAATSAAAAGGRTTDVLVRAVRTRPAHAGSSPDDRLPVGTECRAAAPATGSTDDGEHGRRRSSSSVAQTPNRTDGG